jgi:hypothetical protein
VQVPVGPAFEKRATSPFTNGPPVDTGICVVAVPVKRTFLISLAIPAATPAAICALDIAVAVLMFAPS